MRQARVVLGRRLTSAWSSRYREARLTALHCFPEAYGAIYANEAAKSELYFERFIREPSMQRFVVGLCEGEALIGVAAVCPSELIIDQAQTPAERVAEINQVYIQADNQGQGFGKQLLRFLIQQVASDGYYQALHIAAAPGNDAANRLYQSLGWQRVMVAEAFAHGENHYRTSINELEQGNPP